MPVFSQFLAFSYVFPHYEAPPEVLTRGKGYASRKAGVRGSQKPLILLVFFEPKYIAVADHHYFYHVRYNLS